jgi:hypothetical protein
MKLRYIYACAIKIALDYIDMERIRVVSKAIYKGSFR